MTEQLPLAGAHICHDMGQESLANLSEEVLRLEERIRGWLVGDWRLGDIRASENDLRFDGSESYLDFYYVNPRYRPGKSVKDVRILLRPDVLDHISELKKDDIDGYSVNLNRDFLHESFGEALSQSRHRPRDVFVGLTRVREEVAGKYVNKDHVLAVLLFMTDEVRLLESEHEYLLKELENTRASIVATEINLAAMSDRRPLY